MKNALSVFIVLLPLLLHAQTDPPLVASGSYANDFHQWSFTIGDLAILTLQTDTNCWTQGSEQPVLGAVPVQQPALPDDLASIFPNPAQDVLYCTITAAADGNLHAAIFDAAGRSMQLNLPQLKNNETTPIPVASIPAGSYFLRITDSNGRKLVKTFQKL